jgi:hypothetical protein
MIALAGNRSMRKRLINLFFWVLILTTIALSITIIVTL